MDQPSNLKQPKTGQNGSNKMTVNAYITDTYSMTSDPNLKIKKGHRLGHI